MISSLFDSFTRTRKIGIVEMTLNKKLFIKCMLFSLGKFHMFRYSKLSTYVDTLVPVLVLYLVKVIEVF